MRFHVVALPHTITSKDYSMCAYTQKVLNFCKMMKSLGHTVFHYGGEGSTVECDEHISVISKEQRKQWWGKNKWRKEFFAISWEPLLPYWMESNKNAIREIKKRIQPKDFICLIGGNCQKPIADEFPGHVAVEFGIGYTGTFSKFRVFESYAFMHYMYGLTKANQGRYYDTVVPNYYDPLDFPEPILPKEDFFLFVGRLTRLKGVHIAVDLCNRLGVKLVIAGQGTDVKFTRGADGCNHLSAGEIDVSGNIEYVGTLDVEKRGDLMRRARATLVLTQYIGPFEGVSVESMMCGTPVISTDWGCFAENIVDGVTGFRVRTMGEMLWAAKEVAHLNPGQIRDYAMSRFSIEKVKYRYQDYFNSLNDLWEQGWETETFKPEPKRLLGGFR